MRSRLFCLPLYSSSAVAQDVPPPSTPSEAVERILEGNGLRVVTGRPLHLLRPMLMASYEHGIDDVSSLTGSVGLGSTGAVGLVGLGAGYRYYIQGTTETGLFLTPQLRYLQGSMFGLSVGNTELVAAFGGKYTYASGFVIEGEAGFAARNYGSGIHLDIGLGYSF